MKCAPLPMAVGRLGTASRSALWELASSFTVHRYGNTRCVQRMGTLAAFWIFMRMNGAHLANCWQKAMRILCMHTGLTNSAWQRSTADYPYLITAHDDPVVILKLFKDSSRLVRYFMARNVLKRTTALSAVSEDLRHCLAGLTSVPIEVIPNPLNHSFFQPTSQREAPSTLSQHRFVSVINGWSYWKNAETALRAFALVRQQRQDTVFTICLAPITKRRSSTTRAESKNLSDGVVFRGSVPHAQLIDELKTASAMLHPSRWEACRWDRRGDVTWFAGDRRQR